MAERTRLTTQSAAQRMVSAAKADNVRQLKDVPPYDKDKIDHVKKLVGLVHQTLEGLHGAVGEITMVKSHEISPDGKLGGRGYVMTIKDFRDGLSSALNTVSNLMDTLADELTNPNWGLSPEDIKSILQGEDTIPAEDLSAPLTDAAPLDDMGAPAPDAGLGDTNDLGETPPADTGIDAFPAEPAVDAAPAADASPADSAPAPDAGLDSSIAELGSKEAVSEGLPVPPIPEGKAQLPYARVTPLPYEKIAMAAGRPDLDTVANALRAPILFNMFGSAK